MLIAGVAFLLATYWMTGEPMIAETIAVSFVDMAFGILEYYLKEK